MGKNIQTHCGFHKGNKEQSVRQRRKYNVEGYQGITLNSGNTTDLFCLSQRKLYTLCPFIKYLKSLINSYRKCKKFEIFERTY